MGQNGTSFQAGSGKETSPRWIGLPLLAARTPLLTMPGVPPARLPGVGVNANRKTGLDTADVWR